MASLVYQVSWTRLLTLQMGHTTAAASTVVSAFMGGLACGAFLAGRLAARLTLRRSLLAYIALECFVAVFAVLVPFELKALTPVLAWSYRDGAAGLLFPMVRLLACLLIVMVPAAALGATFPVAVRWFVRNDRQAGRDGGELYAANTTGAAVGALLAGFILIPAIGVTGTTFVGVLAAGLAVATVLVILRRTAVEAKAPSEETGAAPAARLRQGYGEASPMLEERRRVQGGGKRRGKRGDEVAVSERAWLSATVLGLSGLAALTYEIAWTRVVSMIVGPTTYAFAATIASMIAGLAAGSALGSWSAGRTRRPAFWLAFTLAATAIATTGASALAGGYVPRFVAGQLVDSALQRDDLLMRHAALAAALVLPAATGFGAAFPLALGLLTTGAQSAARQFGALYAVNTAAAVVGSLAAGFVTIPALGLQHTLTVVSAVLVLEAAIVVVWSRGLLVPRTLGLVPVAVAITTIMLSPSWDRDLLASGVYKYAREVPKGLDLDVALKAGTLLYYREGAASTVSVKRRTGALSLAIDGKIDGSSIGDMLTQKALAHLPLLLHPDPHDVCVIGLGTGVTLGSALVHPIRRADVVEISPHVVEASRYFLAENLGALTDPRTHLIVGDGRSHLLLSSRTYDVIISEPSNPWMAGVAALFTREFFTAARDRLAPGGIMCQWAHTYDISDGDLRSIVATFSSVFPKGTMWLIGQGDLLLVASADPSDLLLENLAQSWRRPGVAADLARVSALEPFAFWSLFGGGAGEIERYAAGAPILTDDRMSLEFSGPRALSSRAISRIAETLHGLLDIDRAPATIRHAMADAGAAQWRGRAAMLAPADGYLSAYSSYVKAVTLDTTDVQALTGLTRAAVATGRQAETLTLLSSLSEKRLNAPSILIATSRLLAATGAFDQAIATARRACDTEPVDPLALEQLASLFADLGDAPQLEAVASRLRQLYPSRASAPYYTAASNFLRGRFPEALDLAREAVSRDPQNAAAHNLLGAIYASLHQRGAARDAFAAVLHLNPDDSSAYTNLGLLEMESSNQTVAAAYFAEALMLDPRSEAARRGLAQARNRD